MMFRTLLALVMVAVIACNPLSAQPRQPQSTLGLPGTQTAPWNGRWTGTFGARSDMVIVLTGDAVTSVTMLGQPLTVSRFVATGDTMTVTGPDFSLVLKQVAPTSAQGTYENNRREKANALFTRD